jgi:hypothetical protein
MLIPKRPAHKNRAAVHNPTGPCRAPKTKRASQGPLVITLRNLKGFFAGAADVLKTAARFVAERRA